MTKLFSAGRHQRLHPLKVPCELCGICVYLMIVWKTFIFQTSICSLPAEAGPNPLWHSVPSSTERSSAVAVVCFHSKEPKQQRPRNINTVSFSVEQKLRQSALCAFVCICVLLDRGNKYFALDKEVQTAFFNSSPRGRCCEVLLV